MTTSLLLPGDREGRLTQEVALLFWLPTVTVWRKDEGTLSFPEVTQFYEDEKDLVTVLDASRHLTDGVKLWASQRNLSQTPTLQYTVVGDIILVTV